MKTRTNIIFTISAILLLVALGYLMLWLFGSGMDLSWEAFSTFIIVFSIAGGFGLLALIGLRKINKFWLVLICIGVVALILLIEIGLMTLYGGGFYNL